MKGVTLIELMMVIVIFLLISAAIFGILSTGRQSWHTGQNQVELQQETRKAMDWMVKELRESGSSKVTISVSGDVITFQVPVDWEPDGDVLNDSGDIEWGAQAQSDWCIQYLLDNSRLLRRVLDAYPAGTQVGADAVLANNIRSDSSPANALMFIGSPAVNPTVISIEVSAQKDTAQGRTMQSTLHSQVTLRN